MLAADVRGRGRRPGADPGRRQRPRCPIRQIENYLERLAKRDAPHEFYRYDAGHGSLVIAETIKQTSIEVYFALRALGMR